jgi:hypothetical protein
MAAKLLCLKVTRRSKNKAIRVQDLNIREREIYKEIIQLCPDDRRLLTIHTLIQSHRSRWSGRTLDALVTRFHHHHATTYLLDITDGTPAKIVTRVESVGRVVVLFDIADSYKHKMYQYSKMYFDCFARGPEVLHQLNNGHVIQISLCQFMFFIWADVFKVFDFLELEYTNVLNMKKKRDGSHHN